MVVGGSAAKAATTAPAGGFVPGAATAGSDAETRVEGRGRRRQGRALSAALPATFIGLLIVQALRPTGARGARR